MEIDLFLDHYLCKHLYTIGVLEYSICRVCCEDDEGSGQHEVKILWGPVPGTQIDEIVANLSRIQS